MNDKLTLYWLKGLELLSEQERSLKLQELIDSGWSYYQLSKETGIPQSTLHGWISQRSITRRIIPHEKRGNTLIELGTSNSKLKTALDLLISLDKVDNEYGIGLLIKIKKEVRRLEQ